MSKLKKVIGYKSGEFQPDNKDEKVHFTHVYVAYPKDEVVGLCVDIFKCASSDVINDIKPGDYVEAFFNENKKVVLFVTETPTAEDLQAFGEPVPVEQLTEE